MANYLSNYDIAQEISARIGNSPIPFDSVYSICLEIYNELGGEPTQFDSVYEILLGILPLVEGGGGGRYTAGDGINISDENVISANSGAVLNGNISLSNGAPVNALGIWPNNVIPQGTSIQTVLEKLLNRELFPNAATKPNFTISSGALGLKEYKSSVTLSAPGTTKSNGQYNASFSSPSQPAVTGVSWSNETVSDAVIVSGFTGSGDTRTVALGSNKATYTYSKTYSAPSNMPITNLNHPTQSTTKVSTDGSDISAIWDASTLTKTADVTATGVYACFSNISGSTLTDNAATKAGLTSGNELTYNDTPSEVTNNKHFKFAFPADRTVSFKIKDLQGNFVDYSGTYDVNTVTNFYNGIDYKVLETTGGFVGSNTYKFILSKNLNA